MAQIEKITFVLERKRDWTIRTGKMGETKVWQFLTELTILLTKQILAILDNQKRIAIQKLSIKFLNGVFCTFIF